jgi:hypothetical protein
MSETEDYSSSEEEDVKPDVSEEGTFSWLMSKIETHQREIKGLKKQLAPVRKRLHAKMEEDGLETLECGSFVLTMEPEQSETPVVYSEKKIQEFLTEKQLAAYVQNPDNRRPPRKRRRILCERHIIEVDE